MERPDDLARLCKLGVEVLRAFEGLVEEDLGEGVGLLVCADGRADKDDEDVGRGPSGLLLLDAPDDLCRGRAEDGLLELVRDARRPLLHELLAVLDQFALLRPASTS